MVKLVILSLCSALEPRKPGERSDPQVAVGIARHGAHQVAAQAVRPAVKVSMCVPGSLAGSSASARAGCRSRANRRRLPAESG